MQPKSTLRTDARALLESCPGWNGRLLARRISQAMDQVLAGQGMTSARIGLMAQIATAEDDTLGALARRCGMDQSTLSRNLRVLEREGLVELVTAEKDLRRRAVWLTEAGVRSLEAALPAWRAAQAALVGHLPPDLGRTLAGAAEALRDGEGSDPAEPPSPKAEGPS